MSDYVIQFGKKYKGTKIADIPSEELESYFKWLDGSDLRPETPLYRQVQEAKAAYKALQKGGAPQAPAPIAGPTPNVSGRKPNTNKNDPYKGEKSQRRTSFTTPSGTELQLLDFRGKEYLEVKFRLVWFREEHSNWSIETEFLSITDRSAHAKATIRDETGRIVATSHKFENVQGFPDFTEKAETGAIGRALALIGYGTQFCADELDEGKRIVDSPVEPKKSGNPSEPEVPNVKYGPVVAVEIAKTDKDSQAKVKEMGFQFDWATHKWVRYYDEHLNLDGIDLNFEFLEGAQ